MAQQVQTIDIGAFRSQLTRMGPQFDAVLTGSGITQDKFMRIVATAVAQDQDKGGKLLTCSLKSIFAAAMKAAEDGLLPDGHEGALVPYYDTKHREMRAVWVPMIHGLRKKIFQSGEVIGFDAILVHPEDDFYHQEGAHPRLEHVQRGDGGRERPITHVYTRATFRNGYVNFHVMNIKEVEQIRDHWSKAKEFGPWADPMSYPEMVKKTCARQHSKTLPMSADVQRVFRRIDELQGVSQSPSLEDHDAAKRKLAAASTSILEQFANEPGDATPMTDGNDGSTPDADKREPSRRKPREIHDLGDLAQQYVTRSVAFITKCETSEDLNEWADAERQNRSALPEPERRKIMDAINARMEALRNANSNH
jgi:recombination protein RecT